jgi:hypothetical protein
MIDFTKIKKLTIGGVELKQLFINGIQVWKSGYKNWVKFSTTDDGKTIYNGGKGYKTGYRVRSGGQEGGRSDAICTGFIPYKQGDILRIKPNFTGENSVNAINFADSSFVNLGQYNDNGAMYGICQSARGWNIITSNGITTVDISEGTYCEDIAYVRITLPYGSAGDFSYGSSVINPETDFIITVNEEIM